MQEKNSKADALDLIWGAEEIGKAIGRTARATYDILENNQIPAKKVHGRWVISHKKLVAFFMEPSA